MALQVRTLPRNRAAAPRRPDREITIEEARQQFQPGSLELAVAELKELDRLEAIAKEHGNTANRQGTKAKNALKLLAQRQNLEPEDQIMIGDTAWNYDVAYSEKVDVEKLFELFEAGKIKREALLMSISVNKENCTKFCGAHVVNRIAEIVPGKTMDVRKKKLDQRVAEPVIVRKGAKPPSKKLNTVTANAPSAKIKTKPLPASGKLQRRRIGR